MSSIYVHIYIIILGKFFITKIKELRGSDLRVQKERKEKTIIIIKLSYIIPMW